MKSQWTEGFDAGWAACLQAEKAKQLAAKAQAATDELFKRPQPLPIELSPKQLNVLKLMASGLKGREIALLLNMSMSTVRTHARAIYAKMGVDSAIGAVGYIVRHAPELFKESTDDQPT